MRGGKRRRLSVTSPAAAAAVMVGGVFVCSGKAPPYSLLAEWQPALHSRLRLLWLRPGGVATRHGHDERSRHGFSDFSRP